MNDNPPYTCVIVDDEPTARYGLRSYVNKIPALICVDEFQTALSFRRYLDDHDTPDIIFLDIQMPHLSGLDFLASGKIRSAVVLVTAYEKYALKGFELDVCDYLLKPVSFVRFRKAVDKAINYVSYLKNSIADDYIFIRSDRLIRKIRINDITYLEAMENYVMIHTDSERIITRSTLKNILTQLPHEVFTQIHKSFAVNIRHIQTVKNNAVIMTDSTELPLSTTYRNKPGLMQNIFGTPNPPSSK